MEFTDKKKRFLNIVLFLLGTGIVFMLAMALHAQADTNYNNNHAWRSQPTASTTPAGVLVSPPITSYLGTDIYSFTSQAVRDTAAYSGQASYFLYSGNTAIQEYQHEPFTGSGGQWTGHDKSTLSFASYYWGSYASTSVTVPNGTYRFVVLSAFLGGNNSCGGMTYASCTAAFSGEATWQEENIVVGSTPVDHTAISIFNPVNVTSTSISDFTTWTLSIGNAGQCNYRVKVEYDFNSSSSMQFSDIGSVNVCGFLASTVYLNKSQALWFPPLLATTTWYARATLYSSSSVFLASSSLTTFVVNANSTTTNPYDFLIPEPATSTVGFDDSCLPLYASSTGSGPFSSSTLQAFACSLKEVGYTVGRFLFFPSTSTMSELNLAISSFKDIFPFSSYFAIVSGTELALNNGNQATSSVLTLTIKDLNYNNLTLLTLNSTTLKTAFTTAACNSSCANQAVENVFTWVKAIIWMSAGLKIVAMIAHF